MRRRDFVASLSVAVAWPLAARAQAADNRVHRDGHVRKLDPMDGVDTAKRVTSAIPIVFAVAPSPLSLVASLARPGGNVTGLSSQQSDLAGKRLDLLREVVPGLRPDVMNRSAAHGPPLLEQAGNSAAA